jgi:hypothetical protein
VVQQNFDLNARNKMNDSKTSQYFCRGILFAGTTSFAISETHTHLYAPCLDSKFASEAIAINDFREDFPNSPVNDVLAQRLNYLLESQNHLAHQAYAAKSDSLETALGGLTFFIGSIGAFIGYRRDKKEDEQAQNSAPHIQENVS